MYDDYICKIFQFHLVIVDTSLALIAFCPLLMIAGTYQVDSVREGVMGAIQRREMEVNITSKSLMLFIFYRKRLNSLNLLF